MSDLSQLLNIDLESISAFPLQANLVNNEQNKRVIEKAGTALKRIEEKHLQSQSHLHVSPETLDTLLSKVRKMSSSEVFTSRELKILAYHLNQIYEESDVFNYSLELIERNWRDRFFNCFVRFVLENWHGIDKGVLNEVRQRLINKLKSYSGSNNRYLMFKDHCDLFDGLGPIRMLSLINIKNIDLFKAPSILGHPESNFFFSYYDDVIVNYFVDKEVNLPLVEEVLKKHNSSRTNKLVLADLIIKADRSYGESKQVDIGNTARRILGDVTNSNAWTPFFGATEEEVNRLKNAYLIINRWCAKQVIQTFFDVCVQAPDRKEFWSNYVKEISDFRIVGSRIIKHSLKSDKRVREHLNSKFIETSSKTNRTAALIMFIRDRVFIEFSDIGSVYIYMPEHTCVNSIRSKRFIDNINDLKDRSIGQAVISWSYGYDYEEYGYLTHNSKWQEKLTNWINKRLDLNSDASAFLSSNDFKVPDKPENKPNQTPTESDVPTTKPKQLTFDDILETDVPKTEDTLNSISNPCTISTQTPHSSRDSHTNSTPSPGNTNKSTTTSTSVNSTTPSAKTTGKSSNQNDNLTTGTLSLEETKGMSLYSLKPKQKNVKIYARSKLLFEDKCRVIITDEGLGLFYINKGYTYILYHYRFEVDSNPKIWVKKHTKDGYQDIIVTYNESRQLKMGKIKQINDKVILYKNRNNYFSKIIL